MRPGDDAALLIGFLNTADLQDGVEALSGSGPAQWREDGRNDDGPSSHPPAGSATPGTRRGTASMIVLREGLRALLVRRDGRAGEGDPMSSHDLVAEADAVLRSVPLRLSLGSDTEEPALVPARGAAGGHELASVAAAVLRSQLDGSLDRVKVCARPTCRWAYFDASRNRSRHWCSMAGCGNVEKNRSYRARRSTP